MIRWLKDVERLRVLVHCSARRSSSCCAAAEGTIFRISLFMQTLPLGIGDIRKRIIRID